MTASGKTVAITARICSRLLLGRALDVDAVDRRDGHVDRELDRVVGPGQLLLALHLLGELRHPALELVRVAEEASESTFHALHRRSSCTVALRLGSAMPTVEGAGVELAYEDEGHGPARRAARPRAWRRARPPAPRCALAPRARVDRLRPPRLRRLAARPSRYAATTVQEQAEDAAALLRRARHAGARRVVGIGFGGARRARPAACAAPSSSRAAVLVDPPLLAFVPEANEALADAAPALEDALRDGGPAAAVAALARRRTPTAEALARGQASPRGLLRRLRRARARGRPAAASCAAIAVPVVVRHRAGRPRRTSSEAADEAGRPGRRRRRGARTATSSLLLGGH